MRDILTGLAILLIVALSAALAAPFFINWSSWRSQIEIGLTQWTGAPVRLGGPVDLRFLPTPQLSAADISVDTPDGRLSLTARSARFELTLSALMRGDFHFTEAHLDEPQVDILLGQGGEAPSVPFAAGAPERARFERITIRDGSVTLRDVDGAALASLTRFDFDGEADSLAGPFKGSGKAGELRRAFRLSTAAAEPGRLRGKLLIDAAGGDPRAEFDGAVLVERRPDGLAISYEGAGAFAGTLAGFAPEPVIWRLSGPLKADRMAAAMEQAELRLGTEERGATLTGSAALAFERPSLTLALQSKQIDLDRVLAGQGRALPPLDLVAAFSRFSGGATRSLPVSFEVNPGVVTLGGEALSDVSLAFDARPGEPLALRFGAALPGRSRLALDGRLEGGPAARFAGRIDAATQDGPRLSQWLAGQGQAQGQRTPSLLTALDLPFRALSMAGEGEASAVSLNLRNARITLDRTELVGAFAATAAIDGAPARLFADLKSDSLDLDGLPDLASLPLFGGAADLALALEARAVRVARFGQGMLGAGRIILRAQRQKGQFTLERLSVADLGGASFDASGTRGPAGFELSATLDARRLGDFAELVGRLAPGQGADLFIARAARLSPARLTARASGSADLTSLTGRLDGQLGSTQIEATLGEAAPGRETLRILAQSLEAAQVLRQFGLEAVPVRGAGDARIELIAEGDRARIDARLAETRLGFEGKVDLSPLRGGGRPVLSGEASLEAENVMPLLQTLGVAVGDPRARHDADLVATLTSGPDGFRLESLRGWALTTHVRGAGRVSPAEGGGFRFAGEANLAEASAAQVAALLFGAPQPARDGALHSTTAFAAPRAALPSGSLSLRIGRFDLGHGPVARDAAMKLSFAPSVLTLEDFTAQTPGGSVAGAVTLRRNEGVASISGRARIEHSLRDQPWLAADAVLDLDFAGSGRSMAALVSSLGGEGRLALNNGSAPRFSPDALEAAIALVDEGRVSLDDSPLRRALEQALDRGGLAFGDRTAPATLAAGTLRIGALDIAAPGAAIDMAGGLDLRNLTLDWRASLVMLDPPRLWSGPQPQIGIAWKGPLAAPRRELEIASFLNGLSVRHIARETERIQALEADIRERAYFNRRLKAIEFMNRREREIEAWHAEQARLAEIERRRLEEEARRKAEEERRRLEEEAKRKAEEARRAEIERRRLEEEARRKAEEEAKRRAEEARRAEAERRKLEEEARRKSEEERRRLEEEAKRKAEEARRAEIERRRLEELARFRAEEERRRTAEEAVRLPEESGPTPPVFSTPPVLLTPPMQLSPPPP